MCFNELVSVATGIGEREPQSICEGAVWQLSRSLVRENCCPAKGQPLHKYSGVFLLADRTPHDSKSLHGLRGRNHTGSLPIPGQVIRGAIPILRDGWI